VLAHATMLNMRPSPVCTNMGGQGKAGLALFRITLVVLSVSLASCSFAFSKGPSDDEDVYFHCSGYALPMLDTIWAGLNGIGAMTAANASDAAWKRDHPGYDRSTVMLSGFTWMFVSGASAMYGYHIASICADAKEGKVDERRFRYRPSHSERYRAPAALRPPPPAPSKSGPTEKPIEDDDPFVDR
jgi:hypothetical protein